MKRLSMLRRLVRWAGCMLKSCQYCHKIHDSKFDCGLKPKKKYKRDVTDIDKFRWTRKWKEKRIHIKERDLYLCQVCKDKGKYNYDELEVHHIIPLSENYDLKLDDDNLITLCTTHHAMAERGEIKRNYLQGLVVDTPPLF